ncbi:helix-turn-helix domain-containing protein [Streptomyces pratensis]|uniref:helix-turn-helix domain-containing protein n=1 Tax=Streptomyces pratensis TaxID=1169025 RepID=UPI003AFAA134
MPTRWRRQCGGIRPFDPRPHSGGYLSFSEREGIALLNAQGMGAREIARQVDCDPGATFCELQRNAATRGGKIDYRASVAQGKSDMAVHRPKASKLFASPRLYAYAQE